MTTAEDMTHTESIVIVGFGWVGQANALALSSLGYSVYFYDISSPEHYYKGYENSYGNIKRLGSLLEKDSTSTIYVVCVGDKVDEQGNQDISLIEKALLSLKDSLGTVVLRSTVRPDHLKKIDFDIYLPEFLHEKTAVEECLNPYFFVVGKKDTNKKTPSFFEVWRKNSFKAIECTPEEASHIKYLSNIWNAIRIAFVNEYGRGIQSAYGEEGNEGLKKAEKILYFLFGNKPYFQYGKAYTGHCLPKDMRAYTAFSSQHITPHFLRGVIASNAEQEAFQSSHKELQEWYSPWRRVELSGREALRVLGKVVKRRILTLFS